MSDWIAGFDEATLESRLARLDASLRVAFACACAERLAPHYRTVAANDQHAEASALESLLDGLWSDVLEPRMDRSEIESKLDDCINLMPAEDAPRTVHTTFAENAIAAVAYAYRTRLTGDAFEARWAARTSIESVLEFVARRKIAREDHDTLGADALFIAEIDRHERDLSELESIAETPDERVAIVGLIYLRAREESSCVFG